METRQQKPERVSEEQRQTKKLLAQLASSDIIVQDTAERELKAMGQEDAGLLLTELESMARGKRRLWSRLVTAAYIVSMLYGVICLLIRFLSGKPVSFSMLFVTPILAYGIMLRINAVSDWRFRRNQIARILAEFDDVRAVGPLAEALIFANEETKPAVRRALLRLLPHLQASNAHFLNDTQHYCLHEALLSDDNVYVILAILKALEQVGDSKALPYVEKLAASESELIMEAARACLPYLHERIRDEESSRTLLRAANLSETPPDVLLRPANATPETHPQELLRAVSQGEAHPPDSESEVQKCVQP